MSLAPLLPLAGAAIAPVSAQVAKRLSDGLGFLQAITDVVAGKSLAGGASSQKDSPFVSINSRQGALDSLQASSESALEQLSEILRDRLHAADVNTTVPFLLQGDADGKVVVAGQHPDRAAIERIFAEDSSLTSLFHFLSNNFGVIGPGQAAANGDDPRSNIMQPLTPVGTQASPSHHRFGLQMLADDLKVVFG